MQIAERLRNTTPSATVQMARIAREMRAAGRKITDMAEGESDFRTPPHIVEAAHAAALRGETRYTDVAGTLPLREMVAEKFRRDNGIAANAAQVVVGTGAKQLIFNAMMATLDPGDEVVVPTPSWVSYPDIVRLCGGVSVLLPCTEAEGFKPSPAALAGLIGPRTRWLLLNSPGNPTGAVLSAFELAALAEILRAHPQVAVLCDDIYESIRFTGEPFATMAQVAPDLADRVLTVSGLSKSHAMTGWRIGFATGPDDLISAMVKLQGQQTTNAASICQAAALAALTGPQDFLADWLAAYRRRRDLAAEALDRAKGLRLVVPDGAFYLFPACDDYLGRRSPDGRGIETDAQLVAWLLEETGVALVPGSAFGAPGHLRLCFARSDATILRGATLVAEALERLS